MVAHFVFGFDWNFFGGGVAQVVERSLSMREVRGSIPRISNREIKLSTWKQSI